MINKAPGWGIFSVVLLCCQPVVGMAADTEVTELSPVVVSSAASTSLTGDAVSKAEKEAQKTPGNATVIDAKQYKRGATGNLKDTVSFVPGVFAQERSGPETRLSIRGSGLSIPWVIKGVAVTRNGVPLYEADGWYHSQLIEPLITRYTEVYPGANALKYGATNLGGAINYVTHDGYSAPAFSASLEGSDQDYAHAQIAAGAVFDSGWDVFTSLSTLQSDGYRDNAKTDTSMLYTNLGYRHNEGAETRVHIDLAQSKQQLPGALTWKQLNDDPTQAHPDSIDKAEANDFDRYRIELQHIRSKDADSRVITSVFVDAQDVHHPLRWNVIEKDFQTFGTSVRGEHFKNWFGDDHRFVWGANLLGGNNLEKQYVPLGGGQKGALRQKADSSVWTGEVYAEDRWLLTHSLEAVIGAKWFYSRRNSRIKDGAGSTESPKVNYMNTSPKLGLLWQANDAVQLFSNVSRSFEAPVLYEFNAAYAKRNGLELKAQKATTWEMGARGETQNWQWQMAVYRSWVEREILAELIPSPWSGMEAVPFNASKTLHDGIELGFDGYIPISDSLGNIHLRFAGTHTHFTYRGDKQFGDNYLPGVPRQFGNFDALYEHPGGFYAGPTVEAASEYYLDYVNSVQVPSYALPGLKTGYQAREWSVFLNVSNLLDKRYVASTEAVVDPSIVGDKAFFMPGQGRTISAGIRIELK